MLDERAARGILTLILSILYLRCRIFNSTANFCGGRASFNSLFEMRDVEVLWLWGGWYLHLSILYLRCNRSRTTALRKW